MKTLQIARDIVPIGEFKTHAAQVVRDLRQSGRPVVITQNGRPAAVLVSPADFDRLSERARFVSAVREGLADADAGRMVSDVDLQRELDAEFGPPGR
jgi:prevent-host-death family protein